MICDVEFVFVHSYSSNAANWEAVLLGNGQARGRIDRALEIARDLGVRVIANDSMDRRNWALFAEHDIENLCTARNTKDEVVSALDRSETRRVLFVTSPDHLPRVVRDALAAGGEGCLFCASDVPLSSEGAQGVRILEPGHDKGEFAPISDVPSHGTKPAFVGPHD